MTDNYLESVLKRPQMYGAQSIREFEWLLINLLNYRNVLLGLDENTLQVLRSLYLERYRTSCGNCGPFFSFEKRGLKLDDKEVIEFYREFVKRCVEPREEPAPRIKLTKTQRDVLNEIVLCTDERGRYRRRRSVP